MRLYCDNLQLL